MHAVPGCTTNITKAEPMEIFRVDVSKHWYWHGPDHPDGYDCNCQVLLLPACCKHRHLAAHCHAAVVQDCSQEPAEHWEEPHEWLTVKASKKAKI